ncbi:hypothetical protein [Candidatus Ferrigenium straubiae]|jgi:hypothetical protein|uniref:hypothetical protein n=1 Tax=Candidatus Ferrigenium straubiae TaxID=2919506 RepID=UPI003F4AA0EB
MATIMYVRVHPKSGQTKFFRCGIGFTKEWQKVEVDAATEKRLKEEQMLEVSETEPEGYSAGQQDAGQGNAPVVPTDPAERIAAIKDAIGKLDKADAALWTNSGMPKVPAISAVIGWEITAAERDAAWAEIQDGQ